jgi:hypothetical protein
MRTNDQYFQPGDKVMRVGDNTPGARLAHELAPPPDARPKYGVVYCVEDFWEGPQRNVVMLVGFGGWTYCDGFKAGWPAASFRKVEEIKICLAAARQPATFPIPA